MRHHIKKIQEYPLARRPWLSFPLPKPARIRGTLLGPYGQTFIPEAVLDILRDGFSPAAGGSSQNDKKVAEIA